MFIVFRRLRLAALILAESRPRHTRVTMTHLQVSVNRTHLETRTKPLRIWERRRLCGHRDSTAPRPHKLSAHKHMSVRPRAHHPVRNFNRLSKLQVAKKFKCYISIKAQIIKRTLQAMLWKCFRFLLNKYLISLCVLRARRGTENSFRSYYLLLKSHPRNGLPYVTAERKWNSNQVPFSSLSFLCLPLWSWEQQDSVHGGEDTTSSTTSSSHKAPIWGTAPPEGEHMTEH